MRLGGNVRGDVTRRDAASAASVAGLSLLPGREDTPAFSLLSSLRDSAAPGFSGSRSEPESGRSHESASATLSSVPAGSHSETSRPSDAPHGTIDSSTAEGGILLPPFLLSSSDSYTSPIIRTAVAGYSDFELRLRVLVSPIRCSSAHIGVSGHALPLRPIAFFRLFSPRLHNSLLSRSRQIHHLWAAKRTIRD